MAKKGQNLRLFVNGKCIAAATECSYHVGTTLEDSSTKDTTGDWQEQECTGKNWDCSASALVVDDTTAMTDASVLALIGTKVNVVFVETSGAKNREYSGKGVGGIAIVSDITKNANNRQNQTWSVQLTGVGSFGEATVVSGGGAQQPIA